MEAYDRIIETTIAYIEGDKDISIRKIAKEAEVGLGTIHYFFKSKEHLIKTCIQLMIEKVIKNTQLNLEGLTQIERLKLIVKTPIDFLMDNPYISKTSIINDLTHPMMHDNSFETLKRFLAQVVSKEDFFIMTILLHGIQGIFLRYHLYPAYFDFSDKKERDKLIDYFLDQFYKNNDSQQKN